MKSLIAIALITVTTPTLAQTAPVPAPSPAPTVAPAATAKFTLDTPIETLVADPAAKAVLTTDFGGDITANPNYEQFKGMSLNQVQPYAPDKMPAALMTKIAADLAAIK
ncbi:hypothetical protein [Sphingomonas sp.]|jgi:hypothetical protein|uniref:hypothetical protein n=1 Tax=Sphingomonas sp. TaxID=28214 RepID=UPI002E324BDC|nr:hypothetical protein [Sphingomonas sp.]HEX4693300.1 hypothetical protein [Sphingomonas sp.]